MGSAGAGRLGGSPARPAVAASGRGRPAPVACDGAADMFWDLMRAQFGDAYAESVAKDYVLSGLGGRTVDKALADGEDAKVVWRAVCDTFNLPESLR